MDDLQKIKAYLARLEKNRTKDELSNKYAYQGARELSSVVSLAEHGNRKISKAAIKALSKRKRG